MIERVLGKPSTYKIRKGWRVRDNIIFAQPRINNSIEDKFEVLKTELNHLNDVLGIFAQLLSHESTVLYESLHHIQKVKGKKHS